MHRGVAFFILSQSFALELTCFEYYLVIKGCGTYSRVELIFRVNTVYDLNIWVCFAPKSTVF